jgi:phospholipase C
MRQGSGSGPLGFTRREALKVGATIAGAAAVGCGSDAPGVAGDDAASPPAADASVPTPDAGSIDATTIDASAPDAPPPDAALPPDAAPPTADELLAPIDTFVVLCMENRSFDHYLGARKLMEGLAGDGLSATMRNPDVNGLDVMVHRLANFRPNDPAHDWTSVHNQWNQGAMDGFVRAHAGASAADVMGYYAREDLPVTWAMADAFTTCDRYFSSVLGPTWPNRLYLHGATSMGATGNLPVQNFVSLFSRVLAAGKTQKNYFSDIAWAVGGYLNLVGNASMQQFFTDAQQGALPSFSIVDPGFFGAGANDDHPAHDVRLGQAFIASVYAALRQSPQWNRCMLIVTYDEHGGFFDHVPPPECVDERPDFTRLGVRVPTLVAGPYVRRNQVVSTVFEHSSIVSTITRRFGLEPLNMRAAAAADLSSCIDPALLGNPQPGPALPAPPPVNLTALREVDRHLRGVRPESHVELWDMAEAGLIPRHLDRRDRSLETALAWLHEGERLGAVNLR